MKNSIIIVGGQFGDEGKGKIVDFLAEKADVIIRYAGGNNAGHTVVIGSQKYKFHLIPSGITHKGKLNIIGNGTVVDPDALISEIENIEGMGFRIDQNNLVISSAAHIITNEHKGEDSHATNPQSRKIGTTARGIGPCYRDKVTRTGIRVSEYVLSEVRSAKRLRQLVKETPYIINDALSKGKKVMFEGAQGTLLDIDHGTYPYVTSSNPTAGGALTGSGVGPTKIGSVIGVFKAYVTRVGGGSFPTELGTEEETKKEKAYSQLKDDLSKEAFEREMRIILSKANREEEYSQGRFMRMQGVEYGTTTLRPRRTGWFDAVAANYAIMINGLSSVVITKLDVLQGLKKIKICTAYEIDGKRTTNFITNFSQLKKAKPVYEEMDGWEANISSAKKLDGLPANAKAYLNRIQQLLKVPICIVSVGPKREQTIVLKEDDLF